MSSGRLRVGLPGPAVSDCGSPGRLCALSQPCGSQTPSRNPRQSVLGRLGVRCKAQGRRVGPAPPPASCSGGSGFRSWPRPSCVPLPRLLPCVGRGAAPRPSQEPSQAPNAAWLPASCPFRSRMGQDHAQGAQVGLDTETPWLILAALTRSPPVLLGPKLLAGVSDPGAAQILLASPVKATKGHIGPVCICPTGMCLVGSPFPQSDRPVHALFREGQRGTGG